MPATYILLCGGRNERWNSFRQFKRKHLVRIEGDVLIERTIRQLKSAGVHDIRLVMNRGDEGHYRHLANDGVKLHYVEPRSDGTEADKFLSSQDVWSHSDRTVVLLGDVWFSDEAIGKITSSHHEDWMVFGRPTASQFTGHPYRELFAQSFTPNALPRHHETLLRLDSMYRSGELGKEASGWAHYHLMTGSDPRQREIRDRFAVIDDYTDDFDCSLDYIMWHVGRRVHHPYLRSRLMRPIRYLCRKLNL